MQYQNLFSGKSKKNITNLSSAESAKRVVKVKLLPFAKLLASNWQGNKICMFYCQTL